MYNLEALLLYPKYADSPKAVVCVYSRLNGWDLLCVLVSWEMNVHLFLREILVVNIITGKNNGIQGESK